MDVVILVYKYVYLLGPVKRLILDLVGFVTSRDSSYFHSSFFAHFIVLKVRNHPSTLFKTLPGTSAADFAVFSAAAAADLAVFSAAAAVLKN